MTRYLVTGGCGFIGSHLVEALVAAGHAVRVLDDLSTGLAKQIPANVELLVGDVADPATARRALAGMEGCFHLAAIASVARGEREWAATHRVNVGGTVALLDAIAAGPRMPFVYASSAAVYGDAATPPIAEDASCRPISAYGADKLASEMHAAVGARVHAIPSMGLRFFNVFGPRQAPGSPYSGVISIFCDRLLRGEQVTINGDGQQTRDFVHVGDVVRALQAAMASCAGMTGAPRAEVLNVCTGHATTVAALAAVISDLCGTPPQLARGPERAGDIRHSTGNPARLRATLALPPPLDLRAGLADVLAWMRAPG